MKAVKTDTCIALCIKINACMQSLKSTSAPVSDIERVWCYALFSGHDCESLFVLSFIPSDVISTSIQVRPR